MTLQRLPYHQDLLAVAAERILARAGAAAPDLSAVVALVGDAQAAPALRRACMVAARQAGHDAILGLRVTTLRDWIEQQVADTATPLNCAARRLLLVEALREHGSLFGDDDPWRLADNLLVLFEDLTRYRATLPEDVETLTRQLAQSYGITGAIPAGLSREAQIVQHLWQAWQTQTRALQRPDPWNHYLDKLQQDCRQPQPQEPHFIVVGHSDFIPAEWLWLEQRLQTGRAQLLLHGNADAYRSAADGILEQLPSHLDRHGGEPPDAVGVCLDAVYPATDSDLRTRAAQLSQTYRTSPLQGHIATSVSDSAEHEACVIELQVRRWLLEGRQRIGIITEDRRLARRVRALLERAGITLQDSGGWALSTTSAAACVERWLETVEEDFAHQPFLDFLKSPFVAASGERTEHLASVFRLERDIIQHENIARNLARYRRHVELRRQRLAWSPQSVEALNQLLERAAQAAQPLQACLSGRHPAQRYLQALYASLSGCGVWQQLQQDAAGQLLTRLWEELLAAAHTAPLDLHWQEFRTWFGRALEEAHFRPSLSAGPVQLLNLAQSELLNFDALVVGACDREHLPGRENATPFFNMRVRRELGLPTWEQQLALQLYRFRRVLQAAPTVLLSWHREEQGEPLLPSPWVEALETLHNLAFGDSLRDSTLPQLSTQPASAVAAPEAAPLPAPPQQPRPRLPPALLPATESPSSHQHLIDCPYLYFAADCLQLAPSESVRELLQKSDYGERVHLCLQAFHGRVNGYPGPFPEPLTTANREAAIQLLEAIALAVFQRDLEDNFQHRGWLKRWQTLIPSYIDWQLARGREWQVEAVEARVEKQLAAGLQLRGRLDRIDRHTRDGDSHAILDYKTGTIPNQAAIDTGEAVQLPLYALLAEASTEEVAYVRLDGARVQNAGTLQGEALTSLTAAISARLLGTRAALTAGAALPAWGDAQTCRYCRMAGLCRRQAWPDADAAERADGAASDSHSP